MSAAYQCEVVNCKQFVAGELQTVTFFDGKNEEILEVCQACFAHLKQPFVPPPPAPQPQPANPESTSHPRVAQ